MGYSYLSRKFFAARPMLRRETWAIFGYKWDLEVSANILTCRENFSRHDRRYEEKLGQFSVTNWIWRHQRIFLLVAKIFRGTTDATKRNLGNFGYKSDCVASANILTCREKFDRCYEEKLGRFSVAN